jgi:hypothetical protein
LRSLELEDFRLQPPQHCLEQRILCIFELADLEMIAIESDDVFF